MSDSGTSVYARVARTPGKCDVPLGHYDAQCGLPEGHDGGHVGPFAVERDADA